MGIDKTKISAPVSVDHGGALEALALAKESNASKNEKESKSGWLGLSGVDDLLANFGKGSDDALNSTLGGTKSRRKRQRVDINDISLPLERDKTWRAPTTAPTQTPLAERNESRWWWQDAPKVSKESISAPVSAPVLVAGGSMLTQLMMENGGSSIEGLKSLGIEPDMKLVALDEAWKKTNQRAPSPGIPDPDYVEGQVPPATDGETPLVAPVFPSSSSSQPGSPAVTPTKPEPVEIPEVTVAPIFPISSPTTEAAATLSRNSRRQKLELEPEPGRLAASSQLHSARDFPTAGEAPAPFAVPGGHAGQKKGPKMSVLKQLEAAYRHDISANRMKRLQEDARREQNRLDDAEARRELGKAMTIWAAAYNGQLARVEYLIETHAAGPNEWDPNNDNVTPLHLASSQNHVEVARYLLGKGADPNIKAGHLNATPLHWGSKLGHVEIVHLLYKAGADPTIRDGGGFNCLQLALSSGQPGCVAYLVAVMGDLFQAAHFGIIERMVYLLENKFYHVDETADATGKGVTALHLSCVGGHMKCIKYLIDKGATVDVKAGNVGSTPLMWATRAGQLPAVRCLVESGADPRYRDANGYSALNFAQQLRPPRVDIVQFFVKECGLDASDALPPALAGVVESDGVADEDDYAEMDEIEMQAEAKLKEELEGLSKEEVSAFYGATMRKGGVDSLTTLQVQLERAETSESISSQGAKFDPYNVSAKMDPICLAVIKTTHVPRSADELPLTTVGGVVKVLRKFEDLWNLGEIDETTELPDGNSLLRRRRGIYPSGYCTEHSWGEVVAGVKR